MTITVNGRPHQARPRSTVAELLSELQFAARHVAVEVNFEIVPRSQHGERRLNDWDRVEVVTLVGGG